MKKILGILIVILIGCSSKNEKTVSSQSTDTKLKCNCCELVKFNSEIDFIKFPKNELKLELNKDLLDKNYQMVDKEFYNKYLNDKEMFRDWGNDLNENYEIKHYLLGLIENEEICELLIYEKFRLDATEEKLFLLLIDQKGELIGKYLVSEVFDYAGGRLNIYSKINKNELNIISINNEIIDQDGDKYKYHNDSIILKYEIRNNNYILVDSDTSKTFYWE